MKTVIYTRLSQNKSGDSESLAYQTAECKAFAQRQGFTVETVLSETISATSGKRREEFERLIAMKPDRVLAYRLDRVSRSMKDVIRLAEAGISILTVDGHEMDFSSANGKFLAQIMASVAELETSVKSERQKSSARYAAESGKHYVRIRPFGHQVDGAEVPEEANAIREIVRMYLEEDRSFGELAEYLNDLGLKTPQAGKRDGQPFRGTVVRQMLKRPSLAAHRLWEGKLIKLEGWTPIIPLEDHEDLILRLDQGKASGRAPVKRNQSLLSGIMVDASSNVAVSVDYSGANRVRMYRTGVKGAPSIRADVAEEAVFMRVSLLLLKPGAMEKLFPDADRQSRSALITQRMKVEKDAEQQIEEAVEAGLSVKTLMMLEKKRDEKLAELDERLLEIDSSTLFAPFFPFKDGKLVYTDGVWGADVETLRNVWDSQSMTKKREILRLVFTKIEYLPAQDGTLKARKSLGRVRFELTDLADTLSSVPNDEE